MLYTFRVLNIYTFYSGCSIPGQVYTECGSACPPTCADLDPTCTHQCVPGCQCPCGTVLQGNHCVLPVKYTQSVIQPALLLALTLILPAQTSVYQDVNVQVELYYREIVVYRQRNVSTIFVYSYSYSTVSTQYNFLYTGDQLVMLSSG